jgi:putative ABC transport system ATP-binding protein
VVRLENIYKSYHSANNLVTVLNNISLQITPGEFVAIMGQSGSGKTTLMNIIGLLDKPSSGDYYFNQYHITTLSSDELAALRNRSVGFVFQSFMLLPRMTVLENVMLPLTYQRRDTKTMQKMAFEILEKVGLQNFSHRKPPELSGGQQQRVAIARALVTVPKIILADEPTGALDRHTSLEIMKLHSELNKTEKTTIIVVTHDIEVANQCQRKLKLVSGSL